MSFCSCVSSVIKSDLYSGALPVDDRLFTLRPTGKYGEAQVDPETFETRDKAKMHLRVQLVVKSCKMYKRHAHRSLTLIRTARAVIRLNPLTHDAFSELKAPVLPTLPRPSQFTSLIPSLVHTPESGVATEASGRANERTNELSVGTPGVRQKLRPG